MMTSKIYALKYYTKSGDLKPPIYFYMGLLFLARTWAMLIISLTSRETGNKLLAIFYPEQWHFYLGLASGFIAIILFLLSARESSKHPLLSKIWQRGYPFLLLSVLGDLSLQLYYLYLDRFQYSLQASIQLVAVIWLLLLCVNSHHIKASFKRDQ